MNTTQQFKQAIFAAVIICTLLITGCQSPTTPPVIAQPEVVVADTVEQVKPEKALPSHKPLTLIIHNLVAPGSPVHVSLYTVKNKFPSKEDMFKDYKFTTHGETFTIPINDIRYGEFAIATYQDVNSDGKCNRNFIGIPKEPYGFSNNYKPKTRAPHFDECSFTYSANTDTLVISMIR